MTKKPTRPQPPQPQQQKGDRNNIPQEVHREAERVAKNLMRLPPKPNK